MTDLFTLVLKLSKGFLKIWKQTLLPPVITAILYILIFWKFLWTQINIWGWVSYMSFIFPGLLMMSIIMWSYSLTSFNFLAWKMFRNLEEILVSPMSYNKIIIWFCIAWMFRGIMVWVLVFIFSSFIVDIEVYSYLYMFFFIFLTSAVFSLAGLLNWIFANNFDDVNIIPSFIMTPLIYLGWVFYSISVLSPFWQEVSKFNPILYMINWLRYSFIWISDVDVWFSLSILLFFLVSLYLLVLFLIKRGRGIKS